MLKVLPEHKHQGVATALLHHIYQQAATDGLSITTNGFTDDGNKYLRHVMNKLGADHQVPTEVIGIC